MKEFITKLKELSFQYKTESFMLLMLLVMVIGLIVLIVNDYSVRDGALQGFYIGYDYALEQCNKFTLGTVGVGNDIFTSAVVLP